MLLSRNFGPFFFKYVFHGPNITKVRHLHKAELGMSGIPYGSLSTARNTTLHVKPALKVTQKPKTSKCKMFRTGRLRPQLTNSEVQAEVLQVLLRLTHVAFLVHNLVKL